MITFSPVVPLWVTLTLGAGLIAALVVGLAILGRRGVGGAAVGWIATLRTIAVGLFLLLLLGPSIARPGGGASRPELIILVDRSTSMGSRCQDDVRRLSTGPIAKSLGENFDVSWYALDAAARPASPAAIEPTGQTTHLAASIESAIRHREAHGGQPSRVVLVSDGLDHGEGDPVAVARKHGVTIDVLTPTPAAAVNPRLNIIHVESARRALLGAETTFRLTLRRDGPLDRELAVPCTFAENGEALWTKPLTIPASVREQAYFVTHKPTKIGRMTYSFRMADSPAVSRAVDVVDRRFETLFLEDTWRWEFKYLHRLLQDDPSLRATAFLARGGGAFEQFAAPDRRVNLIGFPQSRADLERFDVFIIGDVQPGRWPAGLAASMARLVAEEGKSLVVMAGPNLGKIAEEPELHAILPVELDADSGKPVEGPIEASLRPEAARSPFAAALGDKLPPLDRVYPAVRRRPGASVILEASGKRNAFGNLILLAEQPVGNGRVLFVGSDTLWKWHTLAPGEGPTPYALFWQHAFRALTPQRSSLGETQVWLTPERTVAEPGRPIRVRAEVDSRRPLPGAKIEGAVEMPDGSRMPLVFQPEPTDPLIFQTEFVSPETGTHVVSVKVLNDGKSAADGSVAVQIAGGEESSGEVDLAGLTRLATATGGLMMSPESPETWPRHAQTSLAPVRPASPWSLGMPVLVLLTLALMADWIIRLRSGLI